MPQVKNFPLLVPLAMVLYHSRRKLIKTEAGYGCKVWQAQLRPLGLVGMG